MRYFINIRLIGTIVLFLASSLCLKAQDYKFTGTVAGKSVEMELKLNDEDTSISGRMRYTNPVSEWMALGGESGIACHPMGNLWQNVTLWPEDNPSASFDITINHWDGGGIDAEGIDADGNDIVLQAVEKKKTSAKGKTKSRKGKTATRKKTRR